MGKRKQQLREEDAVIARAAAALVPGLDQSDYGRAAGNAVVASVVGEDFREGSGSNYCFDEGDGSGCCYFLQDDGGNGD